MPRSFTAVLLLLLVAQVVGWGCSSGDGDGDADGDGDGDADITVEPPEPPALPGLTPCPEGWREVPPEDADDVATCDPWPEGGRQECADDEEHFPGEAGCRRIGTACPAGDDEYAEGLPTDVEILYVRAGAPPGGSGTRESPYGRIDEAMAAAARGSVVALSRGTFDEVVELRRSVTLWGACVAETVVASSEPALDAGTIIVEGQDTALRNLRIEGERWGLSVEGSAPNVDLQDVVITGARDIGVWVIGGATVTGRDVVIRETRSAESDGLYGRGLNIIGGTTSPTRVELVRAVVRGNRDVGVLVADLGASLDLSDSAILDTRGRVADLESGKGLAVQDGAEADLERVVVAGNHDVGVNVGYLHPTLRLTDVVIRDTAAQESDAWHGYGLNVEAGGTVVAERTLIERNRTHGVDVVGMDSSVDLVDVVIRDTLAREVDLEVGHGLTVTAGAAAAVNRALFRGNREVSVLALDLETSLSLTDVTIRDTASQESDQHGGRALGAERGAVVEVRRAVFERSRMNGIIIFDQETSVTLSDVVVRDTESEATFGRLGQGLSVQEGASAIVTRALFQGNREVGVMAEGDGGRMELTDVVVSDTRERACATTSCPGEPAGLGIFAYNGAHITARSFRVLRNPLVGVVVARGGTMDLHDGEIGYSVFGASVQTEGFDLDRLVNDVVYHHNERDFDSGFMPVPDPALPHAW